MGKFGKTTSHPLREARRDAADFRAKNPRLKRTGEPANNAKFWRPETPKKV